MGGSSIGGDELAWGREEWRVLASSILRFLISISVSTFYLVLWSVFYYFYFCQVLQPISQFTSRCMWLQMAPEAWYEWSMLLKEVSE